MVADVSRLELLVPCCGPATARWLSMRYCVGSGTPLSYIASSSGSRSRLTSFTRAVGSGSAHGGIGRPVWLVGHHPSGGAPRVTRSIAASIGGRGLPSAPCGPLS